MTFVLDASVTMAWVFDDESHPVATLALARIRSGEAMAPSIWWLEVRNALLTSERNGRGTEERTKAILGHLSDLPVLIDTTPDEAVVFRFARKRGLSFYDATYLELAHRKRIPLATLDRKLLAAARSESVETLEPAAEG